MWNLDDIMVWYSPCSPLASSLLPLPPPPPPRSPLLRFAIMPLPPHLEDQLSLFDFLSGFQEDAEFVTNFNFLGVDFGAAFAFKDTFDFDSVCSGAFEYNNISCEFSAERMLQQFRHNRRDQRPNRVCFKENVKKSCWYRYFTRPRLICKTMHELSSSNRYGEFQHWFCMSLAKVSLQF
jgi:hypothetical protein